MQSTAMYGKVFEAHGVLYVECGGGALLLSHAVERSGGAIVTLDGKEAFIGHKFSAEWWVAAKLSDVRRVAVY